MMKKTLITTAVAFAMGASMSASADQLTPLGLDNLSTSNVTTTAGETAISTNDPSDSYNATALDSLNTNFNDVGNEINSDNIALISGDGNVITAQNADQAVASSDLNATISGNELLQDSTHTIGSLSPSTNAQIANNRMATNTITASYSGASGIAVLSQNTGHLSSIQQSTVVQSNFTLN